MSLTAFQYLEDFPDDVHSNINECDYFVLCNEMCQHLEELCNELIFSKCPIHDITKSCMDKKIQSKNKVTDGVNVI